MNIDKEGYRHDMTFDDIMATFHDKAGEGVWMASCHGPIASHEMVPFATYKEAFMWCAHNMAHTLVDEMCCDCWKDVGGSGTEWGITLFPHLTFKK